MLLVKDPGANNTDFCLSLSNLSLPPILFLNPTPLSLSQWTQAQHDFKSWASRLVEDIRHSFFVSLLCAILAANWPNLCPHVHMKWTTDHWVMGSAGRQMGVWGDAGLQRRDAARLVHSQLPFFTGGGLFPPLRSNGRQVVIPLKSNRKEVVALLNWAGG